MSEPTCVRCGRPREQHAGVHQFCPIYATYVPRVEPLLTAPEEGALHELQRVLREPCDPNDRRRARAVVRDLLAALTAPTEPTHAERGHDDGVPRTF